MKLDKFLIILALQTLLEQVKDAEDQTYADRIKKEITKVLTFKKDGSFKNELIVYKTLLENLDTSSISFPIVSLEKYLNDQNQPFLNSLQIC